MTADLLRQLDAYGDHVESLVDHVDVAEITQRAMLARGPQPSRRRPRLRRVAVAASLIVVVGGAGIFYNSLSTIEDNSMVSFDEIGASLGDEPRVPGSEPAVPRPATVFSATDSFDVNAQFPASIDDVPATTAAPAAAESSGDPQAGRDIVFVADMRVSVGDAEDAADRAVLTVESLGGFLSAEKTTGGADATSVLTFRVPPSAFRTVIDRLGDIGVVTDQEVTADDVTDVVVDLASRIGTAELSVERLRTFLADATSVNDVAKLERELTNRERDLEQLRGQLETVRNRVALATVRVTFSEAIQNPKVGVSIGAYVARDDDGAGCMGVRPLAIEAGEEATLCIQIANTGKTQLTDIALSGPAAELLGGSVVEVEGELGGILERGDIIVLATDITVEQRIREDLTITAVPINDAGDPVPDRAVTQSRRIAIDIAEPGGLPGFGDAWNSGVGALVGAGSVALVVLGAVLPWLWLPAIVVGVVWWRRRHA